MKEIERRDNLSADVFFKEYAGQKPVILNQFTAHWPAIKKWDINYLSELAENKDIKLNGFDYNNSNKHKTFFLSQFIKQLAYNKTTEQGGKQWCFKAKPLPSYLEDIRFDLEPFPLDFFPAWYQKKWWKHLYSFITPPDMLIPLHFDSLCTHNTYFHLKGEKKIIIIPAEEMKFCYMQRFNRSSVDPENINLNKFPLYANANPQQATLTPGDVLYLPPFTLHQVKSLTQCMSVKLDWHNKRSTLAALAKIGSGMTPKDTYYNAIFALGILFKVPSQVLYRFYKDYHSRYRLYREDA